MHGLVFRAAWLLEKSRGCQLTDQHLNLGISQQLVMYRRPYPSLLPTFFDSGYKHLLMNISWSPSSQIVCVKQSDWIKESPSFVIDLYYG